MARGTLVLGIAAAALLAPSLSFAQACIGGTPLVRGNQVKVSGSGNFVGGAVGGAGASAVFVGGIERAFGSVELGRIHLKDASVVCDATTGQCRTTGYGVSYLDARGAFAWAFGQTQPITVCPMIGYYHDRPSNVSDVQFPWTTNGLEYAVGVGFGKARLGSVDVRPFVEVGGERLTTTINYGNQVVGDIPEPTTESNAFVRPGVGVALNRRVSITVSVSVPFVADRLVTTSVMASVGFGPK